MADHPGAESLALAALLVAAAASPAEAQDAPPPAEEQDAPGVSSAASRPRPTGWAELDLRIETPGATVEVDTGAFCALPCRMLIPPGEHSFTLAAPDLEPRVLLRTFEDGRSLRFEGDLEATTIDVAGALLYALGVAAVITGTALATYDVSTNVGDGGSDWTLSYAAAGIGAAGLALAIWGAARGGDEAELEERAIPL